MRRRLKAGQVWEWTWDEHTELHLLLYREQLDDQSDEWRTFRLDVGELWRVDFLNSRTDAHVWKRIA